MVCPPVHVEVARGEPPTNRRADRLSAGCLRNKNGAPTRAPLNQWGSSPGPDFQLGLMMAHNPTQPPRSLPQLDLTESYLNSHLSDSDRCELQVRIS